MQEFALEVKKAMDRTPGYPSHGWTEETIRYYLNDQRENLAKKGYVSAEEVAKFILENSYAWGGAAL